MTEPRSTEQEANMNQLTCDVCDKPIRPGQNREPLDRGYTWVTIHSECNHVSPLPRLAEVEDFDHVEFSTNEYGVSGTVAGNGPTETPVKGYEIFVEADAGGWSGLPTDRVAIVHRREIDRWGDIYAYVDTGEFDDETGEWVEEWQNIGKVREFRREDDAEE